MRPSSAVRCGGDETAEERLESRGRHRRRLVALRGRLVGVVRRLPVGPGQDRGEPLAALIAVRLDLSGLFSNPPDQLKKLLARHQRRRSGRAG